MATQADNDVQPSTPPPLPTSRIALQPGQLSKPEKVWASSSTLIIGFYQAAPYSESFRIFYKKSGAVFGTQVMITPASILGPELAVRQPVQGEAQYFEYDIKKLKPSTQYVVKIKTSDDTSSEVRADRLVTISREEERARDNDMRNFVGALVKLGDYDGLVVSYTYGSGIFGVRILQIDDVRSSLQLARFSSDYTDTGLPVQAYTLSQVRFGRWGGAITGSKVVNEGELKWLVARAVQMGDKSDAAAAFDARQRMLQAQVERVTLSLEVEWSNRFRGLRVRSLASLALLALVAMTAVAGMWAMLGAADRRQRDLEGRLEASAVRQAELEAELQLLQLYRVSLELDSEWRMAFADPGSKPLLDVRHGSVNGSGSISGIGAVRRSGSGGGGERSGGGGERSGVGGGLSGGGGERSGGGTKGLYRAMLLRDRGANGSGDDGVTGARGDRSVGGGDDGGGGDGDGGKRTSAASQKRRRASGGGAGRGMAGGGSSSSHARGSKAAERSGIAFPPSSPRKGGKLGSGSSRPGAAREGRKASHAVDGGGSGRSGEVDEGLYDSSGARDLWGLPHQAIRAALERSQMGRQIPKAGRRAGALAPQRPAASSSGRRRRRRGVGDPSRTGDDGSGDKRGGFRSELQDENEDQTAVDQQQGQQQQPDALTFIHYVSHVYALHLQEWMKVQLQRSVRRKVNEMLLPRRDDGAGGDDAVDVGVDGGSDGAGEGSGEEGRGVIVDCTDGDYGEEEGEEEEGSTRVEKLYEDTYGEYGIV